MTSACLRSPAGRHGAARASSVGSGTAWELRWEHATGWSHGSKTILPKQAQLGPVQDKCVAASCCRTRLLVGKRHFERGQAPPLLTVLRAPRGRAAGEGCNADDPATPSARRRAGCTGRWLLCLASMLQQPPRTQKWLLRDTRAAMGQLLHPHCTEHLGAAHKLAAAGDQLLLRAPAQAHAALLVAGQVRDGKLLEQLAAGVGGKNCTLVIFK